MSDHAKRIDELEQQLNRLINVVVARQRSTDEAIQTLQRNSLAAASAIKMLEEAFKAISADADAEHVRSDECH